ncbi:hypothetical protein DIPPA_22312 [Diplonema papillatum]|nr:hypothetical protein DIPPA_22312 [Diplonema papillatum]
MAASFDGGPRPGDQQPPAGAAQLTQSERGKVVAAFEAAERQGGIADAWTLGTVLQGLLVSGVGGEQFSRLCAPGLKMGLDVFIRVVELGKAESRKSAARRVSLGVQSTIEAFAERTRESPDSLKDRLKRTSSALNQSLAGSDTTSDQEDCISVSLLTDILASTGINPGPFLSRVAKGEAFITQQALADFFQSRPRSGSSAGAEERSPPRAEGAPEAASADADREAKTVWHRAFLKQAVPVRLQAAASARGAVDLAHSLGDSLSVCFAASEATGAPPPWASSDETAPPPSTSNPTPLWPPDYPSRQQQQPAAPVAAAPSRAEKPGTAAAAAAELNLDLLLTPPALPASRAARRRTSSCLPPCSAAASDSLSLGMSAPGSSGGPSVSPTLPEYHCCGAATREAAGACASPLCAQLFVLGRLFAAGGASTEGRAPAPKVNDVLEALTRRNAEAFPSCAVLHEDARVPGEASAAGVRFAHLRRLYLRQLQCLGRPCSFRDYGCAGHPRLPHKSRGAVSLGDVQRGNVPEERPRESREPAVSRRLPELKRAPGDSAAFDRLYQPAAGPVVARRKLRFHDTLRRLERLDLATNPPVPQRAGRPAELQVGGRRGASGSGGRSSAGCGTPDFPLSCGTAALSRDRFERVRSPQPHLPGGRVDRTVDRRRSYFEFSGQRMPTALVRSSGPRRPQSTCRPAEEDLPALVRESRAGCQS